MPAVKSAGVSRILTDRERTNLVAQDKRFHSGFVAKKLAPNKVTDSHAAVLGNKNSFAINGYGFLWVSHNCTKICEPIAIRFERVEHRHEWDQQTVKFKEVMRFWENNREFCQTGLQIFLGCLLIMKSYYL